MFEDDPGSDAYVRATDLVPGDVVGASNGARFTVTAVTPGPRGKVRVALRGPCDLTSDYSTVTKNTTFLLVG